LIELTFQVAIRIGLDSISPDASRHPSFMPGWQAARLRLPALLVAAAGVLEFAGLSSKRYFDCCGMVPGGGLPLVAVEPVEVTGFEQSLGFFWQSSFIVGAADCPAAPASGRTLFSSTRISSFGLLCSPSPWLLDARAKEGASHRAAARISGAFIANSW
jgi:hypothetical protein